MLAKANARAVQRDQRLAATIVQVQVGQTTHLFKEMRAYLARMVDDADRQCGKNHPSGLLKLNEQRRSGVIDLGPQIDKGPAAGHFNFDSGARLSFGITVTHDGTSRRLLSHRFHLVLPPGKPWKICRFETSDRDHPEPLGHARCHVHAGIEDLRLPSPALSPFEILDYIFFVIEPKFR